MWAILVALLIHCHILPKRLLALLAHERHLVRLCQSMCLALSVAFSAVEPLLAAWGTDGDLRIEDMFTKMTGKSDVACHIGEDIPH